MCALQARRSAATTMGFSAVDGLPMGRRSGTLDPGVVLYLITEKGMHVADVMDLLYNQSGLLGVSGISGDMRKLLASTDPRAAEAIQLFLYRIAAKLVLSRRRSAGWTSWCLRVESASTQRLFANRSARMQAGWASS